MPNRTARTVMRSLDVCIKADMPLDQVSDHLHSHHLTGAPVISDDNRLVGFVSEYDCLNQLMQSSYYGVNTSLAKDVMTRKIISTSPNASLIDLASKMNTSKINVIPVVDEDEEEFLGVISRGDVLRGLVAGLAESRASDQHHL